MSKFSKAIKQIANKAYKDSDSLARKKSAVAEMRASGIIGKKKSSLRDDYKPKLKNEKEVYSNNLKFAKQDYSDTIKNYQKTQKRKQRNRKAIGSIGGVTAATVVASNVKDKK